MSLLDEDLRHFPTYRSLDAPRVVRHLAWLLFLGVIGGEECQRVLVEALKDDDIYVRGVAALALAEAGDARAIPALRKLIEDQENARIVQIVRNSIQILERKK